MINDMKLGMKLMRYGYGMKMNIGLMIGCVVVDILCFLLELLGIRLLDGYFLMVIGIIPTQLIFSLNITNITLSSPVRKRMQISIPTVLNWSAMMGVYMIIIFKKWIITLIYLDSMERVCTQLVFLAFMAAFIMACTGILYKYYMIVIVMVMFLSGSVQFVLRDIVRWSFFGQSRFSLVCAALIGSAVITVAAACEYGISLLVYKAPVSKMSMGAGLRSQL